MTLQNVAVGAWSYDTSLNSNVPWKKRVPLLKEAVKRLRQYRDRQIAAADTAALTAKKGDERDNALQTQRMWKNAGSRYSMLFVAPEYMFMGEVKSHLSDVSADRFLSEAAHREIMIELGDISESYGAQMVFVPGSTAYKTPFLKQGDKAPDIAARAVQVYNQLDWGAEQLKRSWGEQGADIKLSKARRIPLAAPLSGMPALTTKEKQQTLMTEAQAGFGSLFIGQNTMYMFHRGKVIGSYSKKTDFHEVLPGYFHPTIFVPGAKAGRATVGGVPLGLEICMDHGAGVLRAAPTKTGTLPSVHVIVSASVQTSTVNAQVGENGYLVHASSETSATSIWRHTTKGFENAGEWDAAGPVGNGWLMTGVAQLDFP